MISIGYWNIHGTSDKLECESVRDWIFLHDIVVLSETKTIASPSVPGYVAVNNSKSRRGGVAMLVSRKLFPCITAINTEDEGVI